MPRRFDARKCKELDSRWRLQWMEPYAVLRAIGVREGMVLADLGCGTGFFTLPASKLVGPGGLVYAVDIQEEMLEALRAKVRAVGAGNVKVVPSDVASTPLPDASVDVALAVDVFHELAEMERFLREAWRILTPKGVLVLLDWKKVESPAGPPLHERLNPEDILPYLERAGGFENARILEVGPYHYGLLSEKRT